MINVSNIERFATHDGPGIRTVIFLKGCTLHCPWCANPETWSISPVLMHDEKKCVRCLQCQNPCPKHAIKFDPDFTWKSSLCQNCHECIDHCMSDALEFSGNKMSVDEIVQTVLKDKAYYDMSKGGVTISGGEALVQFDGLMELLKALKKENLHIALETTGSYEFEKLKAVLEYVDLFLYDFKHIDKDKLFNVTGGRYDDIMSNLTYLSENYADKVIVRIPVIPEFNYDKETLQSMIKYVSDLKIKEVNLLPYHSLGKSKWDKMHKKYTYEGFKLMDKSELNEYIEIGNLSNINVKIGG